MSDVASDTRIPKAESTGIYGALLKQMMRKTHHRGLDEAKAREVPRWRDSDAFTPLERTAMEHADGRSDSSPRSGRSAPPRDQAASSS
jgi:hypothetical protein